MIDEREMVRHAAERLGPPEPSWERLLLRRDRRRRNRRVASGVVALLILLVPGLILWAGRPEHHIPRPAPAHTGSGPSPSAWPVADYTIDLVTGMTRELPAGILRSLGRVSPQYATSPGGHLWAYVGVGSRGTPQIFVAGMNPGDSPRSTVPRQVTHAPRGAFSPAWSPDGSKIAYVTSGGGRQLRGPIFVLDPATGRTTQITQGRASISWASDGIQFTPDGASVIYTAGSHSRPILRVVPATGGPSRVRIRPSHGIDDTGSGSISPDGSLITFLGGGFPSDLPGVEHCGPCRFLADADGSDRRVIDRLWNLNPAGAWSPDSHRLVAGDDRGGINVLDADTGQVTRVARGETAVWLDRDTLLVTR